MIKKKTVIITGGNSGIGLSITETFIKAGYFVIVGARRNTNLNKKFGKNILFVKIDVSKESSHNLSGTLVLQQIYPTTRAPLRLKPRISPLVRHWKIQQPGTSALWLFSFISFHH